MSQLKPLLIVFLLVFAFKPNISAQDISKGIEYFQTGQYVEAAKAFELELPKIKEKYGEKDTVLYSKILLYAAASFDKSADHDKAIEYYLKCINVYKKIDGTHNQVYAICCGNLAKKYSNAGEFIKAEPWYIEAKINNEILSGKESAYYAGSCNDLAELYKKLNDFGKAEPLYYEAKSTFEKSLGKENASYATVCNNLAGLYLQMAKYEQSVPLFLEAKSIFEKTIGNKHPNYAVTCSNLASAYKYLGKFKEAHGLYSEALDIYKNVDGKAHVDYLTVTQELAVFLCDLEAFEIAKPYLDVLHEAYTIAYGKSSDQYAGSCINLVKYYFHMGIKSETDTAKLSNFKRAESLAAEAKTAYEKIYGKNNFIFDNSCNSLATCCWAIGLYEDNQRNRKVFYDKAEQNFIESNRILNYLLQESAKFMSENEREGYLNEKMSSAYSTYYSFFLKARENKANLAGIAYNNALNLKGQLLKSSIAMRKAVLSSGDTSLISTFNKMNEYGKIIAAQYALPVEKQRNDLDVLKEKLNVLEKSLIRKASHLTGRNDYNWQDIKKALKKNETAIEFIRFRYRKAMAYTDSFFYYALVLDNKSKFPKAIFLFEEKQLQELLKQEKDESDYAYVKRLYSPGNMQSKLLYQTVFEAIQKHLGHNTTLYISTTGLLNRIAFDALVCDNQNILSDKYKIYYTSSTAECLKKNNLKIDKVKNAVLFGGIDYDISSKEMLQLAEKYTNVQSVKEPIPSFRAEIAKVRAIDSLSRSVSWSYLPGTLDEVNAIKKVLTKSNLSVQLIIEKLATEEEFKALEKNAPTILHISTHGFYFGYDEKSEMYKGMVGSEVQFAHSANPLLRSGFVLAGGNNAFQGREIPDGLEDGILTAMEIAQLNLFDTKLAVLSACQTGLGDVKGSEGVYGLQRSFKMAGVDYLLFSLWEVPDYQTKELMTSFYTNWFAGIEIREAFKKAQQHLKTKYAKMEGAAFAWAAFVLMK